MSEICAVCGQGKGPEKCEVCGFSDNGRINREFLTPEDANYWLETVVKPYRVQWETKKREAELLLQLEESRKREAEAKKHEAELLAQLEEAKKRAQELTPPSASVSPPIQKPFPQNSPAKTKSTKTNKTAKIIRSIFGRILALLFGLLIVGIGVIVGISGLGEEEGWFEIIEGLFCGIPFIIVGGYIIIKGVFKGE
jgi:hypothetical protein